jgi:hypothetical protein
MEWVARNPTVQRFFHFQTERYASVHSLEETARKNASAVDFKMSAFSFIEFQVFAVNEF